MVSLGCQDGYQGMTHVPLRKPLPSRRVNGALRHQHSPGPGCPTAKRSSAQRFWRLLARRTSQQQYVFPWRNRRGSLPWTGIVAPLVTGGRLGRREEIWRSALPPKDAVDDWPGQMGGPIEHAPMSCEQTLCSASPRALCWKNSRRNCGASLGREIRRKSKRCHCRETRKRRWVFAQFMRRARQRWRKLKWEKDSIFAVDCRKRMPDRHAQALSSFGRPRSSLLVGFLFVASRCLTTASRTIGTVGANCGPAASIHLQPVADHKRVPAFQRKLLLAAVSYFEEHLLSNLLNDWTRCRAPIQRIRAFASYLSDGDVGEDFRVLPIERH